MERLIIFSSSDHVKDFYNRNSAHQPDKKYLKHTTSQTRNSHARPSARQPHEGQCRTNRPDGFTTVGVSGQHRCRTEQGQAGLGVTRAVRGRAGTGSLGQRPIQCRVTGSWLGREGARSMKAKQSRTGTRQGHHGVGPDQVNARRAALPLALGQPGDRTMVKAGLAAAGPVG